MNNRMLAVAIATLVILLQGCVSGVEPSAFSKVMPKSWGGNTSYDNHRMDCSNAAYLDKSKADRGRSDAVRRKIYEDCMAKLDD